MRILQVWLNQGSWDEDTILDYPGGPSVLTCEREAGEVAVSTEAQVRVVWERGPRARGVPVLQKLEETASRSSLRDSEGSSPADTLTLPQWDKLGVMTSSIIWESICVFLSHWVVVTYYSGKQKCLQRLWNWYSWVTHELTLDAISNKTTVLIFSEQDYHLFMLYLFCTKFKIWWAHEGRVCIVERTEALKYT